MSNNFSLTTFSSDGTLDQVNYAITAANNGETSLAIKTKFSSLVSYMSAKFSLNSRDKRPTTN